MIVFRVIAQILIAAALMLLGWDAMRSFQEDRIVLHSFSEFVSLFGLTGLDQMAQNWNAPVDFLSDALFYIVTLPGWVILGVLGLIMAWIFRPRID